MRFLIPLLLCCFLCTTTAFAQRYVDSTSFYYYVTEDTIEYPSSETLPVTSRVFPVWSTRSIHQDSSHIYELFKYINFESPDIPPNRCIPQNAAGKLGHRIIETPQTLTLFNKWNEPILIRLNIMDTSWIAYDNDSLVFNMVRLPDEKRMLFDSIYTINRFSLDAFFKDSISNSKNVFDHTIIEIAEGLGVVTSPMLDNFPVKKTFGNLKLLGLINTSKRQHLGKTVIPKPEHLYEVGEQFDTYQASGGRGPKVYNSGYSDETWTRRIVTSKKLLKDSVYYTYTTESINHKRYAEWNNPIADYDSLYKYPTSNQTLAFTMQFPSLDQIVAANERTLNERNTYIYFAAFPYHKNLDVVGDFYINNTMFYKDSLWCLGFSDESLRYKKFFGIGIPEQLCYDASGGDGYGKSFLLFAKKNGQTWGTPYPSSVGVDESPLYSSAIQIYPNPSNHTLLVHSSLKNISHITLYDHMGKQVLSHTTTSSTAHIEVSQLPSGYYWLKAITTNSETMVQKIMVVH